MAYRLLCVICLLVFNLFDSPAYSKPSQAQANSEMQKLEAKIQSLESTIQGLQELLIIQGEQLMSNREEDRNNHQSVHMTIENYQKDLKHLNNRMQTLRKDVVALDERVVVISKRQEQISMKLISEKNIDVSLLVQEKGQVVESQHFSPAYTEIEFFTHHPSHSGIYLSLSFHGKASRGNYFNMSDPWSFQFNVPNYETPDEVFGREISLNLRRLNPTGPSISINIPSLVFSQYSLEKASLYILPTGDNQFKFRSAISLRSQQNQRLDIHIKGPIANMNFPLFSSI